MNRRDFFLYATLGVTASSLWGKSTNVAQLNPEQSRLFRRWMVRIIAAQFTSGPTPRWEQRDCVGLVRFAVAQSFHVHDTPWKKASSLAWSPLPPELSLTPSQRQWGQQWKHIDGSYSAYISALELIQENTRFLGKESTFVQAGDLLFYDQGEAQHLMVWMGTFIAYHTGTSTQSDNGLRAVSLQNLMQWSDTRWQPSPQNPNFAGFYRLNFLSA